MIWFRGRRIFAKKCRCSVDTVRPTTLQNEYLRGTMMAISIFYKKGFHKDGTAPLWLYAYGAYGDSTDASFSSTRLSLVDRGFVFAIAHVRGGGEFGRTWYEDGKLLKKKNSFTDFI